MRHNYPLFKIHLNSDEALKHIHHVFESGFINEGEQVTQLTNEMSRILKSKNIVMVNSCTSALTMALKLSGVEPGDDVVTTSMTCVATNMPIVTCGANVRWSDVDPDTGMLTPETIEEAITEKTKAVIVVMWAGNPSKLDEIKNLCARKNVKLILDAAHSFGAKYDGRPVHEFGDMTAYSFQAIKHVTTGDGGALVSSSDETYVRSKKMKWFGLDRDRAKDDKGNWKGQQWDVDIDEVGYKFNMNNLTAAVGLSQIDKCSWILDRHRQNSEYYDEFVQQNRDMLLELKKDPKATGSSWVYTVLLSKSLAPIRDEVLSRLNADGIHAGVVHVPNHAYTVFKRSHRELPGVDEFFSRQFSLPCGWWMNKSDIRTVYDRTIFHIDKCIMETQ